MEDSILNKPTSLEATYHTKLLQIRNELKNIRTQQSSLKESFKKDVGYLRSRLNSLETLIQGRSPNHLDKSFPECPYHSLSLSSVSAISSANCKQAKVIQDVEEPTQALQLEPIGYIESMFKEKNGIPRQPRICKGTKSKLIISRKTFSNPHHLLLGLEEFSHVWIIFVFHKNNGSFNGTKVKPPRLDGAKVGVFATRSPYRPNAVGLTLAQIERVEDNIVYLLDTDILDGTPVIDIKPYIPEYDSVISCANSMPDAFCLPSSTDSGHTKPGTTPDWITPQEPINSELLNMERLNSGKQTEKVHETVYDGDCYEGESLEWQNLGYGELTEGKVRLDDFVELPQGQIKEKLSTISNQLTKLSEKGKEKEEEDVNSSVCTVTSSVQVAKWIRNAPAAELVVLFTPRAAEQLEKFSGSAEDTCYRLCYFRTAGEVRSAIVSILTADPRSVYRRKRCSDRLYYMTLDVVHVCCWFDGNIVEVIKIEPVKNENRPDK